MRHTHCTMCRCFNQLHCTFTSYRVKKMSILNALRNKIIQIIFACIQSGKKYEKNYQKKIWYSHRIERQKQKPLLSGVNLFKNTPLNFIQLKFVFNTFINKKHTWFFFNSKNRRKASNRFF
jgi:hypothetical protein